MTVDCSRGSVASRSTSRRAPSAPGSVTPRVGEGAAADDVVDDDEAARTAQAQRPGHVLGVVRLVGVDEDQVVRAGPAVGERGQRLQGRSDPDVDHGAEPSPGETGPRHLGVARVHLERVQVPVGGQGARQPDRAVATERPDLQHPPRPHGPRQQLEQCPLQGGHRDGGHPGLGGPGHRRIQRLVRASAAARRRTRRRPPIPARRSLMALPPPDIPPHLRRHWQPRA